MLNVNLMSIIVWLLRNAILHTRLSSAKELEHGKAGPAPSALITLTSILLTGSWDWLLSLTNRLYLYGENKGHFIGYGIVKLYRLCYSFTSAANKVFIILILNKGGCNSAWSNSPLP